MSDHAPQAPVPDERGKAAIKTLDLLRYTYAGGDLWRPPLGKAPRWDIVDAVQARAERAEANYEETLADHRRWVRRLDVAILRAVRAALSDEAAARTRGEQAELERAATPSSRWRAEGKPDPHVRRYDCERSQTVMGDHTDDELANAVFLYDHRRGLESMAFLTAAKDRIRWLSRALQQAVADQATLTDRAERAEADLVAARESLADADKRWGIQHAELARLRAENSGLREALSGIRDTSHAAVGIEAARVEATVRQMARAALAAPGGEQS